MELKRKNIIKCEKMEIIALFHKIHGYESDTKTFLLTKSDFDG